MPQPENPKLSSPRSSEAPLKQPETPNPHVDLADCFFSARAVAGHSSDETGIMSAISAKPALKKVAAVGAALACLYSLTGKSVSKPVSGYYPQLPAEITVKASSLPVHEKSGVKEVTRSDGTKVKVRFAEKVVRTKDIDFSKKFWIDTGRYKVIKDEDFGPGRWIGKVYSLIPKLIFWDWKIGNGLDPDGAKAVLSTLENNRDLKNVTVRVNHNSVLQDCGRLFSDERVVKRNPWIARVFYGVPSVALGELWAECRRGDYYNPMTGTTILYSNVPAVWSHELGHHIDFKQNPVDWPYVMMRPMPGLMLYQEWKATENARDKLLPEDLRWQFGRYLIPALATYILATWAMARAALGKLAKRYYESESDAGKRMSPLQVARYYATGLASFGAGAAMFKFAMGAGVGYWAAGAALVGSFAVAHWMLNNMLRNVVRYDHERRW